MLKQLRNNKGSLTVESAIVLIYVIGVVFMLVHMAHGIYQQAYMQAIADEAVEMGQRYWLNPAKAFTTGVISETETQNILYTPLYRYPYDAFENKKETMVEAYIWSRLQGQSYEIFKYDGQDGIEVECKTKDFVMYKKITVTIKDTKKSPFRAFRRLFLLPENRVIEVKAEGVIHDPAEYIRTLDLSKDLILETQAGQDAAEKMGEWRDKLSEYLGKWTGESADMGDADYASDFEEMMEKMNSDSNHDSSGSESGSKEANDETT